MLLNCTRMLSACYRFLLVCYPYVPLLFFSQDQNKGFSYSNESKHLVDVSKRKYIVKGLNPGVIS